MDALLATAFISLGAQPPPAGTGWTAVVSKGRYGTFDGSSTSFNAVLTAAMNMGVPVIRRDCAGCDVEHKSIFYRRLTPVPSKFSLFECFKNNWTIKSSNRNAFNVDFELYSALDDALAGNTEKRWTFCNGDDVSGVGFPRDCGRTVQAVDQWNSFSGRGGQPDVLFAIAASKTPGPPAPQPPAPTPAPPSRFCPMYHPVRFLSRCRRRRCRRRWTAAARSLPTRRALVQHIAPGTSSLPPLIIISLSCHLSRLSLAPDSRVGRLRPLGPSPRRCGCVAYVGGRWVVEPLDKP